MAKRTNAQRLRAARVASRPFDDIQNIRRDARERDHAAQASIGHRFGLCAFRRTIRSRTA